MLITIPKALRELLDWQDGELLVITAMRNSLVVLPVRRRMMDAIEEYVKENHKLN